MSSNIFTEDDITNLAGLRKGYETAKRLLDVERGEDIKPLEHADPDVLKAARKLVGMSQGDMADALGITQASYSGKENHPQRITDDDLGKMIEALNCASDNSDRSSAAVALVLGQVKVDTKFYSTILEEQTREEAAKGLDLLSGEELLTVHSVIISMIESMLLHATLESSEYRQDIESLEEAIGGNLITDSQRTERDRLEALLKEVTECEEPLDRYLDSVHYPQELRLFINDERNVEEVADGFTTISRLYES